MNPLKTINQFLLHDLWGKDLSRMEKPRALLYKFLRLLYVAVHDFRDTQMTLWAMSLVYTTIQGLVPFLAVSFSVLKTFGVRNQLERLLLHFLSPLGEQGIYIAERIISFVEKANVDVLGSVGLALLVYTVITIIQKVEQALNYIWKIKKERSFAQKFKDYMSIVLVGPILIFAAVGLTATIASSRVVQRLLQIEHFGRVLVFLGGLFPFFFIIIAFTFIYFYLPNTKVRFKSALVGGAFSGTVWQTIGLAYASYISSSKSYSALYSGFAIIMLFIIWLYLNWRIFLVGASLTFYHQYPYLLAIRRETLVLSNRIKERLALILMYLIGKNFYEGKPGWSLEALVQKLNIPVEALKIVLLLLEQKRLILEHPQDSTTVFIPARALDTILIQDILKSARTAEEETFSIREELLSLPQVDAEVKKISAALSGAIGKDTLKDLIVKDLS
jgi:membrane protein